MMLSAGLVVWVVSEEVKYDGRSCDVGLHDGYTAAVTHDAGKRQGRVSNQQKKSALQ